MTDDREWGSDIENMGPGDVPEPGPDEPELVGEEPAGEHAESEGPGEAGEHSTKHGIRQSVAKAAGVVVELGSILAGQGGEIVGAERAVAEAETEELVDRVDGEG